MDHEMRVANLWNFRYWLSHWVNSKQRSISSWILGESWKMAIEQKNGIEVKEWGESQECLIIIWTMKLKMKQQAYKHKSDKRSNRLKEPNQLLPSLLYILFWILRNYLRQMLIMASHILHNFEIQNTKIPLQHTNPLL